jgi:hypothetical protein
MTTTGTAQSKSVFKKGMAALLLACSLTALQSAAAADSISAAGLMTDLANLRVQVTPPPLDLEIAVGRTTAASVQSALGEFTGFNASAVQTAAAAGSFTIDERVSTSSLWAAVEDVYNTLSARCDYWIQEAAGPTSRRYSISDVEARVTALAAGARQAGAAGTRQRVQLEDVDALMTRSENFLDGLAAVTPPPLTGRVSTSKLNAQVDAVYQDIVGLCADLQAD